MIKFNHANLSSFNVPPLTEFFKNVFGMQVLQEIGAGFALLTDDDGFLLTLMHDKQMTPDSGYPTQFHVGFRLASREEVDARYSALAAANYAAPKPKMLAHGSFPAYGFYCQAPGGVTVEVSTNAL
jgi:catechol-2,3-dioxygenase